MDEIEIFERGEDEAGIFTWCLDADIVYADTAVAELFGIEAVAALRGLPLVDYLARIHSDDRPATAKKIALAVMSGAPYRAEYRVEDRLGKFRWIMAFGRCFRDPNGNPRYYSGIVHRIDLTG